MSGSRDMGASMSVMMPGAAFPFGSEGLWADAAVVGLGPEDWADAAMLGLHLESRPFRADPAVVPDDPH